MIANTSFDIVAFARRANINPVDYALATGQMESIQWSNLTDHELRYCQLSPDATELCAMASAEMEARVERLVEAGITLSTVNVSMFLPRLTGCLHASLSLKQRVEEVSLPVLLAALEDFAVYGLATSILRSFWKEEYKEATISAERRWDLHREEEFEAAIASGSFDLPTHVHLDKLDRWRKYIQNRDLSGVDVPTLIDLTGNSWWRMRALHELVGRVPLEVWLQGRLRESYDNLTGEVRALLMAELHRKLVTFEEVRKFQPLYSFAFLGDEAVEEFRLHALGLCRTPDDIAFLKSHYGLSEKQAMDALSTIQRTLETLGK